MNTDLINTDAIRTYMKYLDVMNEVSNCKIDPTDRITFAKTESTSLNNRNANEVIDVNIIVPHQVVEVTFADETKEKAVCKYPDKFTLEQGISICISKKAMGGSAVYNKAVKTGMKVYNDKLVRQAAKKEEQDRIERKRAKKAASKELRMARLAEKETKRLQAEREEMIEIQKEAYLRAIREVKQEKKDRKKK